MIYWPTEFLKLIYIKHQLASERDFTKQQKLLLHTISAVLMRVEYNKEVFIKTKGGSWLKSLKLKNRGEYNLSTALKLLFCVCQYNCVQSGLDWVGSNGFSRSNYWHWNNEGCQVFKSLVGVSTQPQQPITVREEGHVTSNVWIPIGSRSTFTWS